MMITARHGRKYELTLAVLFLSTFLLVMKSLGVLIISESTWLQINSVAIGAYLGSNVITKGINAYANYKGVYQNYDEPPGP